MEKHQRKYIQGFTAKAQSYIKQNRIYTEQQVEDPAEQARPQIRPQIASATCSDATSS